jgi:GAF domain-containing protein
LQRQGDIGYSSYSSGEIALETGWQPDLERAFIEGQTFVSQKGMEPYGASIGVPIKVRDTVIGVIGGYKSDQQAHWTEDEKNFLQDVADVLGVALESARSYQQVQLTAQRERVAAEVTGRIRRSLEMETILRAAAEEVRKALGLPEVTIQLGVPTTPTVSTERVENDTKGNGD